MVRTEGRGLDLSYLKTTLGSRDAKPVQEIEKTGVGEELTTCLNHPCFTLEWSARKGGGWTCLKQPLAGVTQNRLKRLN